MKRRIFSLAAVLLLALAVSVQAMESRIIHPTFGLSFSGGQVTISETYPVTKGRTYTLVMEYSVNGEPKASLSTYATC